MKKYLFIVFLITISNSLIADTPFSVRRDNVKVFTSPNFENEIPSMEYFYGDTISITLYSDLWAEVILPDGKKGYVKKENLLPATNGFGTLSPEEKIATPLYRITSATVVLRKPDNGSGRVPLQFKKHQILYDAVAVNDDWMSIPIGGGETGYMKTMCLNEISHEEKVEMFGQKPEQHTEIQNTTGRLSGYVNGWQTGPKFIFIIIAVCTILLLLTLYRRNRGPLKGKMLGMFANTLLILSLLEIWYFYSAGMNRVYWFLSFDHILRTLLYVVIMIVFTWVQASAGLNLMDDTIKPAVRDKRKYLWIAAGIAGGLFRAFPCQKPKKKTSSEKNPFLHLLHVDNRDRGKPGHGVDTYIYRIRRFPGFSCRQTNTCERSIAGRSCDQSAMLRLQTLPRRQSDLQPEQ